MKTFIFSKKSKPEIIQKQPETPMMSVFFDMVPDLLCVATVKGHFKMLNPAWESLLGYSVKELYSQPFVKVIHPDDVAGTLKNIDEQIKGKATKSVITRFKCKDNSYKWIEWQAKISVDGSELYAVGRDVTERYKTEQALIENEKKYKVAFSTSPDAININKMDGTYVDINDGFTKLTGYTKEDVIGLGSMALGIWVIPKDREKLVEGLQEYGMVKNLESVFRSKNGSLKHALMSASIISINNEPHILSVTRDITMRVKAEKMLRESEEKYRFLATNSSDVIWTMDLDGKFTYVSPSVEQFRGYTPEEVIRMGIDGFLTPESAKIAKSTLAEHLPLLKSGEKVTPKTMVIELLHKNGSTVWAEMTINTLFSDNHKLLGFVGITRDITERLRTEEKLKNSEEIFRSLAEHSPNMIFIVIKNKIYFVNQLCVTKLGYSKEELYAPDFDFEKLVAPEHKDLVNENILIHKSGKEPAPFEFLMVGKNGRVLYTMVNAKLIQIGKDNAVLGVIMDISEQRWAEEILKKKANQFEHFNELMVERELKLVELKKEVNLLLEKLGEKAKY